jgi:hypothetical protein
LLYLHYLHYLLGLKNECILKTLEHWRNT